MGRIAFLFAGQGAQVPGMASDVKDFPKVNPSRNGGKDAFGHAGRT